MKASETKLVKLLEGTQQYVVPLFQRTYKWEKKHWEELWNDLMELYEDESKERLIGIILLVQWLQCLPFPFRKVSQNTC